MHTAILEESMCAKCRGVCCRRMPGICTPGDIMRNYPSPTLMESVVLALDSGHYSIDNWEGGGYAPHTKVIACKCSLYYIRPRIVGHDRVYDPVWGGQCIFLTDDGCKLPPEDRPTQCRILVPDTDSTKCTDSMKYNGKYVFGRLWSKYINLWEVYIDILDSRR